MKQSQDDNGSGSGGGGLDLRVKVAAAPSRGGGISASPWTGGGCGGSGAQGIGSVLIDTLEVAKSGPHTAASLATPDGLQSAVLAESWWGVTGGGISEYPELGGGFKDFLFSPHTRADDPI